MNNTRFKYNDTFQFPVLSVEQTERLLSSVSSLPIRRGIAGRIRTRVLKKALPRALTLRRIRRTLMPIAACLLILAMFIVCFPKAAQAVASYIGSVFTPVSYMSEDPQSRTPVPSIDEAIAAAAPEDGAYTITLMPDLPEADDYIAYRAQNGYSSFSEEDWGWLQELRPEIAEVLYDGNQLIWNTDLYTANEHVRAFMELYGIRSGSAQSVDALMDSASYTIDGDPTVYPLDVGETGITPIYDATELSSADHVVLYSSFDIDPEAPLPDGIITITQKIRICEADAMNYGATVAILAHTFTFDTTQGNTASAEPSEGDIPLSGETYLSYEHTYFPDIAEDYIWTIETKKVSLDGVVLHADYEYLPTGISVVLTLASAPLNWTDDMIDGLLRMSNRNIQNEYYKPGNVADLYIDGVFVSEAPKPDSWSAGEQRYILPVYPDQYDDIQSITLKLTHVYYETRNGTDQIGGEVFSVPPGVTETVATYRWDPLVEITVPLP